MKAITRESRPLALVPLVLLLAASAAAQEPEPPGLVGSLTGGDVKLALRYRFEGVEDDAFELGSEASTLRLALGYETKAWKGFAALIELESVTDLGLGDRHANGASGSYDNGVRGRPVIADPELAHVNQALLRFGRGRTTLEGGRFELLLANERFFGAAGWRQNHQSFDGVRLEQGIGMRARVGYAWIGAANRVTGDRKPMSSHLGYASFDVRPALKLRATVLATDYTRSEDASLSSTTVTAAVAATRSSGSFKWLLDGEAGWQWDAAENPAAIDEPYLRAELGAQRSRVTARVGVELIGGSLESGHGSLQTPLATQHKWNGWADKFLTTPQAGILDTWVSLAFDLGSLGLQAVWHDFRADAGAARHGSEWDLLGTWDLPWNQQIAAKAALYDAEAFASDTAKVWLYTAWSF